MGHPMSHCVLVLDESDTMDLLALKRSSVGAEKFDLAAPRRYQRRYQCDLDHISLPNMCR